MSKQSAANRSASRRNQLLGQLAVSENGTTLLSPEAQEGTDSGRGGSNGAGEHGDSFEAAKARAATLRARADHGTRDEDELSDGSSSDFSLSSGDVPLDSSRGESLELSPATRKLLSASSLAQIDRSYAPGERPTGQQSGGDEHDHEDNGEDGEVGKGHDDSSSPPSGEARDTSGNFEVTSGFPPRPPPPCLLPIRGGGGIPQPPPSTVMAAAAARPPSRTSSFSVARCATTARPNGSGGENLPRTPTPQPLRTTAAAAVAAHSSHRPMSSSARGAAPALSIGSDSESLPGTPQSLPSAATATPGSGRISNQGPSNEEERANLVSKANDILDKLGNSMAEDSTDAGPAFAGFQAARSQDRAMEDLIDDVERLEGKVEGAKSEKTRQRFQKLLDAAEARLEKEEADEERSEAAAGVASAAAPSEPLTLAQLPAVARALAATGL